MSLLCSKKKKIYSLIIEDPLLFLSLFNIPESYPSSSACDCETHFTFYFPTKKLLNLFKYYFLCESFSTKVHCCFCFVSATNMLFTILYSILYSHAYVFSRPEVLEVRTKISLSYFHSFCSISDTC